MDEFTVSLRTRSNVPLLPPAGLTLTPLDWGATTQGGWDSAKIEATGPEMALHALRDWLRCKVEIHGAGGLLWEGRIEEISLRLGNASVAASTERLFNAISVIYSYTGDDGGGETGLTGWLVDSDSAGEFGRKDALHSAGGEMTKESAEALRQTLLDACAKADMPDVNLDGAGSEFGATLYCRGLFGALDDRYYEDAAGYEAHEGTGGGRVLLGWAYTASTIGFVGFPNNRIADMAGKLTPLDEGDQLEISGSASNNGVKVVKAGPEGDPQTYSAATISFDPTDDIADSAQGLGFIRKREVIHVAGSPNNNGYYFISDVVGYGRVEATGSFGAMPIQSDSAGPTVAISMGHNIETETALVSEIPGATVTMIAYGARISQQIQIINGPWTAGEIAISIAKHGAPSDSVIVELRSSASDLPDALLASGTLPAAEIPAETEAWRSVKLGTLVTLSNATKYHIVVRRTGGSNPDTYYSVSIDADASYSRGDMRLWDGAAWQERAMPAHMAFKVWALMDSTKKIAEIVAGAAGPVTGVFAPDAAGTTTRKVRDGRTTAGEEIRQLMRIGNNQGQRMMATVMAGGMLRIEYESPALTLPLTWCRDGRIRRHDGSYLLPGVLPVGRWVYVERFLEAGWQAEMTRFLIGSASFNAQDGTWSLSRVEARDPFDLGTQQG